MKFQRALTWVRDSWLGAGFILAMILVIEAVLSVFFRHCGIEADDNRAYRAFADTYRQSVWPAEYFEEDGESRRYQWTPYAYWRRKPFQGQHINVDSQGIRKTWNPNVAPKEDETRPRIFFFGGSTMWGTGARDDFTIPSSFAKHLAKNGINAEVINFGEAAYVSTQEVILLVRELQKGNTPDLVIFYDGFNDTFSAYQQGRAGLPQNEFHRVREFNSSNTISFANIWSALSNEYITARFLVDVFHRVGIRGRSELLHTSLSDSKSAETLADDVLTIYEGNIEIVDSLAERYSFDALFYWQPDLFRKRSLTEYEEEEKTRVLWMQPFFDMTHQMLRQRDFARGGERRFQDLSLIFLEVTDPLFIDSAHLGETGNERIAERLAIDARSLLGDRSALDHRAAP